MTQETKFPEMKPRRRSSLLKRQRLAVLITVGLVILLTVALILVWRFTSRHSVEYADGTRVLDENGLKYYTVQQKNAWVMKDEDGNLCDTTSEGLYKTHDGATLVMVDQETGTPTVVAAMQLNGTEAGYYNTDGSVTILLYPILERADIQSIEVKNEKDHFTFVRTDDNTFVLQGNESVGYNDTLFSTLVSVTGYTKALRRLEIDKAFLKDKDGNYIYEQYEGFRTIDPEKGEDDYYDEYGLHESPNYYVITAIDGTTHKIMIGNKTLDGAGYYARPEGKDEVYILIEGSSGEYTATFSQALLCTVEDYATPTVVSPLIGESNYFDVNDFAIRELDGITDFDNLDDIDPLINFSYSPLEHREGTFYEHIPYRGQGRLEGYAINDYQADICLQNILDMSPRRTVKLYSGDDKNAHFTDFIRLCKEQNASVAYLLSFVFNAERLGEEGDYAVSESVLHAIWISSMIRTEDGEDIYYLYNEDYNMVIEVGREYLEYLEWNDFQWIASNIFTGNIGYLEKMEIEIKGGTTVGVPGINKVRFDLQFVDSEGNVVENGVPNDTDIKVFASYNGIEKTPVSDTMKYRYFYQTLLASTLEGTMPEGSEDRQEELKGTTPDLKITLTFEVNGEYIKRTYCFYSKTAASGRGAYVTISENGGAPNGSFYMLQNRVNKIINDVGRALSADESVTIDPAAKS